MHFILLITMNAIYFNMVQYINIVQNYPIKKMYPFKIVFVYIIYCMCVYCMYLYIYVCMYVNECATVNGYISCHFLATFWIKYFYLSLTHTHRQAIKITHIQMYSDTNTQVSIIHHPVCFFHFQQQHTITFSCIYSTKIWVRSSTSCIDYS